jgi:filamentous hemagglutinin family protein
MTLRPSVGHLPRFLLLSGGLLLGVLLTGSAAQVPTAIRPDGTLGTTVSQNGNVYNIMGGTRPGNGPNLFHSFERFSVGTNATARFSASGPPGIQNILSRVTGGQQSLIDGRLQSTIPGANLYLLNPSGVLFGPNASLEVSGSFHVSTADYLRFADGATLSAQLGEKSTLTVAPPVAFGFLGNTPAPITIPGSTLTVLESNAMSVVGGEVQIVGARLIAPGGRIQIASVASPGEVRFNPLELAPHLQVDTFARLGRLDLSQGALLDASGDGGGTVLLRGGRLMVDSAFIGVVTGDGNSAKMGIDLGLAEEVVVDNSGIIAGSTGHGNVGEIRVEAGTLTLRRGAVIGSLALSSGKGGNITVSARGSVSISGRNEGGPSGIGTFAATEPGRLSLSAPSVTIDGGSVGTLSGAAGGFVGGRAGDTVITADNLTLSGGGGISSGTATDSDGGSVTIETGRLTISGEAGISASSGFRDRATGTIVAGRGAAGNIMVNVGTLTLTGGAHISSLTFGPGRGGTVTVRATDALTLTGTAPNGAFPSGIFASAEGGGAVAGDAGAVVVEARNVTLTNGAQIGSATFGPGQGGTVRITAAATLTLTGQGSGLSTSTTGSGHGGNLFLQARLIQLAEGAAISAGSSEAGNAGSIRITATDTFVSTNSAVTAEASKADGGNITLTVGSFLRLRDSQMTAKVGGGPTTVGGNIIIDPEFVVLERGQITANAFAGRGGNIQITAGVFLADPASQVSASSALGIDGAVDIQAPVTNLSGVVAPLSPDFARATALLQDRCAARLREGTVSTFMVRGRPSPATSYDHPLPSRLYTPQRPQPTPAGAGSPPEEIPAPPEGRLLREPAGHEQETSTWTLPSSQLALALSCAR